MNRILYGFVIFLSVGVSAYAFSFFFFPKEQSPVYQHFINDPWVGFSHVYGGAVALLFGSLQFSAKFRQKYLSVHRTFGIIYLIAILIGGIAGFFAAIDASGNLLTKIGFLCLDILWLFTTIVAYKKILDRDFIGHRNWMIRSFAMTFAAVTLRLQFPLWLGFFQMPFSEAYVIISWACWVPNVFVAEYIVRKVKMAEV